MMNRNKNMNYIAIIGLFTLFIGLTPLVAAQAPAVVASKEERQADTLSAATDESYRIGPGDVIDIVVSKQPDYSRLGVRVDNNGMVQISRDDRELRAACSTVKELANEVKDRYRRYLRNPYVYVEVREFHSQPVAVIGAVNAPGRFQLQRRVRLLELLTYVNGPSQNAGGTIQIIRTPQGAMCDATLSEGPPVAADFLITYNLKETLKAAEAANPYLRPGDIVRLTDAEQAFLIGAVRNPTPISLKDPVTLSEAIARSGGLAPDANSEKIRIVRHVNGSTDKTEIIANLKAINKRQTEDIFLQANDVVEVPGPSGAKKFLGDLMKTIVPRMVSYPMGVIP